jgi:HAD superfamily hydrolase (TIGR01549 family)
MFRNNCPERTLKQVFDPHFYPPLGLVESKIRAYIDRFYVETFPTLRNTTQVRPSAKKLIETAFERGWQVAIATNPLFPRTAITQRLAWAGVPPEQYPFAIIPSYEDFHFAKPNPAYFAELLGRIGWPRGPVVMVGDDPDHDMRGASQIGIPTFWISAGQPYPAGFPAPHASGNLDDVLPWLEAIPAEELQPDHNLPSAITATLRATPAVLASLCKELPVEAWLTSPQPDEWCLTEIFCHLRDVEREVNLPRLVRVIEEDEPFIPGIDSDAWASQRNYRAQDGQQALREFTAARIETLALLDPLEAAGWQRPANHAIFGPTSLNEIASIVAGHDRLHIRQVHQGLAALAYTKEAS